MVGIHIIGSSGHLANASSAVSSGYGLAVANAQHDIAELVKILKGRGVNVR